MRRKKNLATRECASMSAKENGTRSFMILKVNNPRMNYVVGSSREFANVLKMEKECNKSGYILARRRRAKESEELWKNFRVMKSFQQERRRVETLKEIRVTEKNRNRR